MKNNPRKILLIGSYGRGNIGDDMFLSAAIPLFKQCKIYVNSANDEKLPSDVKGKVETISTTSIRDWRQKIKVFLKINDIVYWGGDVWVEYEGDKFPRQALYKMLLVNMVSRLFGKKIYYIGCGMGALSGYSLWLAKLTAKMAVKIITREKRSANKLGLGTVTVLPDIATTIPYYKNRIKKLPDSGKFTIGISLLYYIPEPRNENFNKLIKDLSKFIKNLPSSKFKIVLFPLLVSKEIENDDLWALNQLRILIPPEYEVSVFNPSNLRDTMNGIWNIDLLIGTRLHANILGTFSGIPCLGISYRPKVNSFFSGNHIEQYCINIGDTHNLYNIFNDMYNNYTIVSKQYYDISQSNLILGKAYQKFTKTNF